MDLRHQPLLRPAVAHLLAVLQDRSRVGFNQMFYGHGDKALERSLRERLGLGPDDGQGSPANVMEEAIDELERRGIVRTARMLEALNDFENDYEIAITAKGRAYLSQPQGELFPRFSPDGVSAVPQSLTFD